MYRIHIPKIFQYLIFVIFFQGSKLLQEERRMFNEEDSVHCAFLTIEQNFIIYFIGH